MPWIACRSVCTTALGLTMLSAIPAAAQEQSSTSVASARSAAPASISERATIMNLQMQTLYEGTNGWMCMPDDPAVPNESPMCLDEQWVGFLSALINKRPPSVTRIGFGYMLQGDIPVSNTDPFATGPTADNQWLDNGGPHIMMVVPDAESLDGISSDPRNGGPWVMWKGTPYAHVMIPTAPRR